MKLRPLCPLLIAFALAACSEPPPNLLLISIDTLRADKLEAYGHRRPTSPAIAAFAAQGLVVETAISTSPWTLPAHASLLTGLYPTRHRMQLDGARVAVRAGAPGRAALAAAGFVTRAPSSTRATSPTATAGTAASTRFEHVPETAGAHGLRPRCTARAEAWLEATRERPFFLFLHYYDVHSDYSSMPRYERELVRPYDGPVERAARGSSCATRAVQFRHRPIGASATSSIDTRRASDRWTTACERVASRSSTSWSWPRARSWCSRQITARSSSITVACCTARRCTKKWCGCR